LLDEFARELAGQEDYRPAELEKLLQNFVTAKGIKVADVIHALRVAVTGKSVGFGMFETLAILGKEEVLARIRRAISLAQAAKSSEETPVAS
jgi:glutamyl-tRNA synthetase